MYVLNMDGLDTSLILRLCKDNLVVQLESIAGQKDLIIAQELMKPFDLVAGVQFLKKHGVDKIFLLGPEPVEVGCERRIFITRPYVSCIKLISAQIMNDKLKGIKREYRVVLVPQKLAVVDYLLEQEGIYGDVTVDECPVDLIPLDNDLVSMEMKTFVNTQFVHNSDTWICSWARAIQSIQRMSGSIPEVFCIGRCSKMVHRALQLMMSEEKEYVPPDGPDIDVMILIDRDVDFVTPLCSQLVYEGLVADTFDVKCGFVEFGKEVTGRDQKMRVLLNSNDKVYNEIRGMHFTRVFGILSSKAKQLQTGYDKKNKLSSVNDLKNFVSDDLRRLKEEHKSLATHIGACEAILKKKTEDGFEKLLQIEHCILEDCESKESINYIENCINQQLPATMCLRLMCLLSLCKGGIELKTYKSLKHQFLQSFGYNYQLKFELLSKVGLCNSVSDKKGSFPRVRKRLQLIPKDPSQLNIKDPQDVSYVFGGAYTPLSIKIIEQCLSKTGIGGLDDVFKMMNTETLHQTNKAAQQGAFGMKGRRVLIGFLGGCSYTEVNALRFLGNQLGIKFFIATSCVLSGASLLESIN